MTFDRWDIVIALFPFTEIAVRKPRPVLVLSHASFNLDHGHLIGAMITTGARSQWPSDHPIADLSTAGLGSASIVRWKLFTLPLSVIARRIGRLGDDDRARLMLQASHILPSR
jgi:mRNA interferase MazF